MNIKKLTELHLKVEEFLFDYANGKYGKCENRGKITKILIKQFMLKASQFDLEEVMSYTTTEIINDMLADKGTDNEGASDLEDWIYHVLNKE